MTVPVSNDTPGHPGYPETDRQNAELTAMGRMLDVSEGCFSLSVAVCNSPALRDHLIRRLAESGALEVVSVPKGTVDVYQAVIDRVKEASPRAVFVVDLEASVPSRETEQLTLVSLNASRELWEQRFACPVVFWLPAYAANLLAIHAKDFWRYRSHRFEFVAEAADCNISAMPRSDFDYSVAANLSADEKRLRIEELEQRIRDAGMKPEPQLAGFVAEWRNEQGILHAFLGKLDEAEQMHRKAFEIEEQLGRLEGMANSCCHLGNVYHARGDWDAAKRMFLKALDTDQQLGRREGMAINYGSLGNVYHARGDLAEAERMFRKSIEINEQLGQLAGTAVNYHNLGNVYHVRGNLDLAERMYQRACKIDEQLGQRQGIADDYGSLGRVHAARGDLDEAERMFRKAFEIHERLGLREGMANDYTNLGHVCYAHGDLDEAERMWQKALDLYEQIGAAADIDLVRGFLSGLREGDY